MSNLIFFFLVILNYWMSQYLKHWTPTLSSLKQKNTGQNFLLVSVRFHQKEPQIKQKSKLTSKTWNQINTQIGFIIQTYYITSYLHSTLPQDW